MIIELSVPILLMVYAAFGIAAAVLWMAGDEFRTSMAEDIQQSNLFGIAIHVIFGFIYGMLWPIFALLAYIGYLIERL